MKNILALVTALAAAFSMTACSANGTTASSNADSAETPTLRIAYQYGMAYAPYLVMKEQKLIEKHFGKEVNVEWSQLNSGTAINEAMTGGSLDVGAVALGPLISGVASGLPYKMFASLSSQPHMFTTNDDSINSLKDFGEGDQIGLVTIGSLHHMLLAMAAEKELGDPHALDGNLIGIAHPDGMESLRTGAIKAHFTSTPYCYKEAEMDGMHQIDILGDLWPAGNSYIIGIATTALHDDNPELYNALVDATQEAVDFLNNNKEEAAAMLCENEGVTKEQMLEWLNEDSCIYSTKAAGIMDLAAFMDRADFAENVPDEFSAFAYDNVKGN